MASSDCSCSVRERRISATGPEPAPSPPPESSGRERASYSSPSMSSREMPVPRSRGASSACASGRSVEARIWPSMPKATSLPVIFFSCAASAASSMKPVLNVPRISRCGRSSVTGMVTTWRIPFGCGSRLRLSRPASASRTAGWFDAIAAARGDPPAA